MEIGQRIGRDAEADIARHGADIITTAGDRHVFKAEVGDRPLERAEYAEITGPGRLMVKPVMTWPWPSSVSAKGLPLWPTGAKPSPALDSGFRPAPCRPGQPVPGQGHAAGSAPRQAPSATPPWPAATPSSYATPRTEIRCRNCFPAPPHQPPRTHPTRWAPSPYPPTGNFMGQTISTCTSQRRGIGHADGYS